LAVNRPHSVQVSGSNNVTMNIPLPEKFVPDQDSWHTWKKSLEYFFRTINLPRILTQEGCTLYPLDVHSRIITMLLRIIPEVDRAWIVERDDHEHPDKVYDVWKYLDMRYGTRQQQRLHEKLLAYEYVQQAAQESITDYVLRLKRIVEELKTLGHAVDPLTHKLKLLRVNPAQGINQAVHDMHMTNLRSVMEELSIESIEDKLIMYQQLLHEQQRATQIKGVYAAATTTVDDQLLASIRSYTYGKDKPWIRVAYNSGQCPLHKQLGRDALNRGDACPLRELPAAQKAISIMDERRSEYNNSRSNKRPTENGPRSGAAPIKQGESK
jgi:hypothetical protein